MSRAIEKDIQVAAEALAFAKLYDHLTSGQEEARQYVLKLCEGICHSRSWKFQLARGKSFYVNLDTVEIACGLDALAEGLRIIGGDEQDEREDDRDLANLFEIRIRNAVDFLQWAKEQVPVDSNVGQGGLGYGGIQVLEQRLDVTGHAISALIKLRGMSTTANSL